MKFIRNRLRTRDLVMLALIVAATAAAVVLIGRELDVGRQATATQEGVTTDSEPSASGETSVAQQQPGDAPEAASGDLTLTLTAPAICETRGGRGIAGSVLVFDDDDNLFGRKDVSTGWVLVAETPVRWSVSGGSGPYQLEIDNETRDGFGPYEGALGTAWVSCALNPGKVFYKDYDQERRYRADPEIDSGLKTIRATVTDSTGTTADASVDVYVILQITGSGTVLPDGTYQAVRLSAGETYRIYDLLFTVPPQGMIEMGEEWVAADGSRGLALMVVGHDALVWINPRTGEELSRHFSVPRASVSGASESGWSFDDYFDALAESRGELPVTKGEQ